DGGDVGAGEVVDRDLVGAALGRHVDLLDAADVHGDGADVAGQPQPRAVGGDVDLLGDVGAVELQGVLAGLALDDVVAVAGVPHERVVAGAHLRRVVAGAAENLVVALAADQQVVARTTFEGELNGPGGQAGGVDDVVAALSIDHQGVVGPFRADDVHGRR